MSGSITLTFPVDDEKLAAVLAVFGVLPTGGTRNPTLPSVPITAIPAAPSADGSPQVRSFMNPAGLAVIDAAGAAVIADPRNASAKTMAALRLLASKSNLSEAELLATVGADTLAGNKAATTKRVQAAIGSKTGAVLYRIENKKVVMADETRRALARHFGFKA